MVFLDVVYNHFGPEGNYLARYAPQFFSPAQTPWGDAIDYQRAGGARASPSRTRCIGCAITASTACGSMPSTPSPSRAQPHAAASSARRSADSPRETGRHIHLVLENDDNQASLLDPRRRSAARQVSRAVERRLSPRLACAADRRDARLLRRLSRTPAQHIARTLAEGFAYQGEPSPHRDGQRARRAERGAAARPPSSISCRTTIRSATAPLGERLTALAPAGRDRGRARRHAARARRRRCCSWARNGARASRSRFSATSRANWRKRCATAAARSSPRPMRARRRGARSAGRPRPCARRRSIGRAIDRPEHRTRLDLVRELLAARQAIRHPAPAAAAARHGRGRIRRRRADRRLVVPHRRNAVDARQPLRPAPAAARRVHGRRADLGRRAAARAAAVVGLCGDRRPRDAAAPCRSPPIACSSPRISASTMPRARALSQGARHHASLCLAVSQGAAGQHARLRHRRSRRAQSRTRRRGRPSRG